MSVKNLKQKKTEYRSKYRKIRQNLLPEKKALLDKTITENLISSPEYLASDVILAFVSKDIEIDTYGIINQALSQGKRVAVPLCSTEDKLMDFYLINTLDDLEKGAYGIMEPKREKCPKLTDLSRGICLVPGLVFDREGYRLGFGKGYYDRFLTDFSGTTVGICYSRCIEEKLPRGYYDKPVDLVITDKYTIDTRNI